MKNVKRKLNISHGFFFDSQRNGLLKRKMSALKYLKDL